MFIINEAAKKYVINARTEDQTIQEINSKVDYKPHKKLKNNQK